ncbi:MAG TPA: GIY-YIG nuclease family protein [Bacillota bacterium]|nr:GIY-YIG nuclease family protein [Bacillota bacterium]
MQIVTLKWHGPYNFSLIENRDIAYEYGIYSIYQIFGGRENLLYIGKTTRDFMTRLNEHLYWMNKVRGTLKIRLGVILLEDGQRFSRKRLSDVESLLITWHSPPENTTNAIYYYGRENLTILNIGRRGHIAPRVSTDDLQ